MLYSPYIQPAIPGDVAADRHPAILSEIDAINTRLAQMVCLDKEQAIEYAAWDLRRSSVGVCGDPIAIRSPNLSPAAALGRLGGKIGGKAKSDAKTAAVRENGKKGGWPKGKPRKKP